MGILQLCATEEFFANLRDPKTYVATIATQNGQVATLSDRNVCATLRDQKQMYCDFLRPKKCMLRPLRLKMGMLRLCATETFARLCATQNIYVATLRNPKRYVATIATQYGCV